MQARGKRIVRWSLISFGIAFLLFMILGVHLYYVTDNFYAPKGPQTQLARIDFHQQLSAEEVGTVRKTVDALPSVQKTYFNTQDNILVYAYTVGEQDQQFVYEQVMQSGKFNASRFVVNEQLTSSGCPVMAKETSGLLGLYKNIFSLIL